MISRPQHTLTPVYSLQQPTVIHEQQQRSKQFPHHRLQPSTRLSPLRGRSSTTSKADTSNLFVSLDFLQQPEIGPGQSEALPPLLQRGSPASVFWDSPDVDSSSSSEQEWRRSLASDADPIHKRSHRSSSREPPGAARIPSRSPSRPVNSHPFSDAASASPPSCSSFGVPSRDTDSLSRDRSFSTSRLPQRPLHLAPWAADTGSPLRQTVEFSEPNGDANKRQAEQRDAASMNNGRGECVAEGSLRCFSLNENLTHLGTSQWQYATTQHPATQF